MLLLGIVPAFPAQWQRFRGPNGGGLPTLSRCRQRYDPIRMSRGRWPCRPDFLRRSCRTPVSLSPRARTTGFTISLDRQTGKINWKAEAPKTVIRNPAGPTHLSLPSPVTDGNNVYVFFDSFGLLSYDSTGKERWRYEIGAVNLPYGAGSHRSWPAPSSFCRWTRTRDRT